MKKYFRILPCILALCFLASCGNGNDGFSVRGGNRSSGVKDVLDQMIAEENSTPEPTSEPTPEPTPELTDAPVPSPGGGDAPGDSPVDVDLTLYSGTALYGKVVNIYNETDQYIGRTVRMRGIFSIYQDESSGRYYFSCLVMDNTACCAVGIEFVLPDSYRYPEDYPEIGDEICVTGILDTYREDGYTYCTLRNAELL